MATIDRILDRIIAREGGYTNHPADRGGPTNMGVTHATLYQWHAQHPDSPIPEQVSDLEPDHVRAIYRAGYYTGPGFDCIRHAGLLEAVVDAAVHSGPQIVTRWMQQALGLTADGILGPRTRAAIELSDPDVLRVAVFARRIRHLGAIITRNPSQAAFAAGWFNRVADLLES